MSNTKFEAKTNTGALFANHQKQDGTQQPDYRGYVLVGDTRVQLAGWKRKSKAGASYVSIQVDSTPDDDAGDENGNACV